MHVSDVFLVVGIASIVFGFWIEGAVLVGLSWLAWKVF